MPDVLGDIIRRIDALEAAVFGRASEFFNHKLTKPQVALREAKSVRQVERDVEKQVLPPPDEIINGRWYWWLSTLERHDREQGENATDRRSARSKKVRGRGMARGGAQPSGPK
jgi:hypothetical protein